MTSERAHKFREICGASGGDYFGQKKSWPERQTWTIFSIVMGN